MGVIGTGATGVQVIQEIAKTVGVLTVFQLQPNFCAPLHNSPIDAKTQVEIHASYPEIFDKCRGSIGGFIHQPDPRSALELPAEEREAFWEKLYSEPGFGIWLGNFADISVNEDANALMTEFIAKKIRARVDDPEVAEKLIPKDHGFGTRRVPLETHYYEAPIEWSSCNVSLMVTSAPAEAWPAELAWVAQPATRRSSTQTPPVPGPDNQAKHAGEPRCSGAASFR